jgi:hypothetical protein
MTKTYIKIFVEWFKGLQILKLLVDYWFLWRICPIGSVVLILIQVFCLKMKMQSCYSSPLGFKILWLKFVRYWCSWSSTLILLSTVKEKFEILDLFSFVNSSNIGTQYLFYYMLGWRFIFEEKVFDDLEQSCFF